MEKSLEIQKLRGISIISVVVIHVLAQYYSILDVTPKILGLMFVDIVAHFAVPSFIFISGLVLSKYQKYNIAMFYNKRVKSIFIPYIFASLWYFLFWYIVDGYNPPIGEFFNSLLKANSMYHLWYFIPLIQLYLLYPIINFLYMKLNNSKAIYLLLCLALVIQLYSQSIKYICYSANYIFYFVIGICCARNGFIDKIYKIPAKFIAFLTSIICVIGAYKVYEWAVGFNATNNVSVGFASNYQVMNLLDCIMISVTIVVLINVLARKRYKILAELGKYSYGIYLYHVTFVFLFIRLADKFNLYNTNILYYIIGSVICTGSSYIFVKLISKLEFLRVIIGSKE